MRRQHFLMTSVAMLASWLTFAPAMAQTDRIFETWQVRAGGLYLHRTNLSDDVIVRQNADIALLNSSEVDPGGAAGWEFAYLGRVNETQAIEFRYFETEDFEFDRRISNSPGGLGVVIEGQIRGIFTSPTVLGDVGYRAELANYEVNGRFRFHEDIELICGYRHFTYEDRLSINIFKDPNFNLFEYASSNRLDGVQLGLDACLLERGPWRLESLTKCGFMRNRANAAFNNRGRIGADFATSASDSDEVFSFLGEQQFIIARQITRCISLRAGYHLLFLTNISTAPNQVLNVQSQLVNGGPSLSPVIASETPVYHGLTLQLEFRL